ncbi:hypothetical protein T01_7098 [Trichinella spiralis]|uniref:Uncharacterized protein n=1 Tax=Trichinella spiralis TaxID=6334 RepID=A0A0V1AKS3_TRISP|nr:hypothetical protein T01_7098 [Trichinella spiralis]
MLPMATALELLAEDKFLPKPRWNINRRNAPLNSTNKERTI